MRIKSNLIAILYALGANVGIAIAKFVAALLTGSGSMLAEGIHSLVDSCNQLLLLLGIYVSKKPADQEHPLGYGKAIFFWSFIVAIMLFSMGGMFSIYEGIHKLKRMQNVENLWIAIIVLMISIILEITSLLGALRVVKKSSSKGSLFSWFKGTKQSELMVVVGEDIAAVVGLGIAFIAVIITIITSNPVYDAMGSIFIGLLLIVVAVSIGKEISDLLIGERAEPEAEQQIRSFILQQEVVEQILNLITLQLGNEIMVAVKIKPKQGISVEKLINVINEFEEKLKEQNPYIKWVFVEPDFFD